MKTAITIEHLQKHYGDHLALDIDHLSIEPGAIYGLIGKNGAGKSTLMKALLGLIDYKGQVRLFDREVTPKNQVDCNRHIGSLIENPSFYGHLSGRENLEILCELKNISKSAIDEALTRVGLREARDKKAKAYSLGMKQRLGIAMAIMGKPKLLILDEPINGLDPYGIEEMRKLFLEIVKDGETTLLISSHILDEVEKIATHIGILEAGHLHWSGSLADYRKRHPARIAIRTSDNEKAIATLGLPPTSLEAGRITLGNTSDSEVAKIVRKLASVVSIYRIEEERESLESLFMHETE